MSHFFQKKMKKDEGGSDTEKILRLLRCGQPQAVCHFYLAGRGQRHLLRHADSRRRHRHSGAAVKECHHGDPLGEPRRYRDLIGYYHCHQHEGHHAPDPCGLPRLRQQADRDRRASAVSAYGLVQ